MSPQNREAFYLKHIKAQEKSGLSIPAYCKKVGVGKISFYSWRKKLQPNSIATTNSPSVPLKSEPPSFLPITIKTPSFSPYYSIEFPNGTKMTILSPLSNETLTTFLTALKEN